MSLDPQTLLVVSVTNLLALAVLLPVIMGKRLSPAARAARLSLIVHAGAWIAVILSEQVAPDWANRLLSTLSMAGYGTSHWLLFRALGEWLGERAGGRLLGGLAIALPIGYLLLFDSYSARVGWANLLIALQLAILCYTTLRPRSALRGSWRFALLTCFATMGVLTLARGVLGAFYPELYPNFAAPHPVNVASLLVANVAMVLANVSLLVAWREEAELRLEALVLTDPLTKLLNRRGWEKHGERTFALARRHNQPLALLSFDLDHFKAINDQRGHEAGDAALRLFGKLLHSQQRQEDVVARIGGEEFCALLPLAGNAATQRYDARLRRLLADMAPAELGYPLDFSTGLACLESGDTTLEDLRRRSDAALYRAKAAGRGQLSE